MKDLIILGAGPAGLSAAIYGIRAGLDLEVIEKFSPGGQVVNTYEVENYPGFAEPIAGWELMSRMEEQAKRLGMNLANGEVVSLNKDNVKKCITLAMADGSVREARTVIAATGASFRKLQVPGEKEFLGRGVSYCATCDGAFFKNKVTAVVGGGDVALEEAHFLTRFADKVFVIHRREEFRGAKILQDRALHHDKVEALCCNVVESINGSERVESVTMRSTKDGKQTKLECDGVFIFIGYDPITGYLPAEVLDANKEVAVDMRMKTSIPGLFAAGDLRAGSVRQIVTAAADGATAALSAYDFLNTI